MFASCFPYIHRAQTNSSPGTTDTTPGSTAENLEQGLWCHSACVSIPGPSLATSYVTLNKLLNLSGS